MVEKFKLNLIKKEIARLDPLKVNKSEDYGFSVKETRWFVETNDGFDGTANGYGYKTPQAVYKAYAYFKSKDQRKTETKMVKENPALVSVFEEYYRTKNDEPSSIEDLLECLGEDQPEVVKVLQYEMNR